MVMTMLYVGNAAMGRMWIGEWDVTDCMYSFVLIVKTNKYEKNCVCVFCDCREIAEPCAGACTDPSPRGNRNYGMHEATAIFISLISIFMNQAVSFLSVFNCGSSH